MGKFCTNCGSPLESGQTKCPACSFNVKDKEEVKAEPVENNTNTTNNNQNYN